MHLVMFDIDGTLTQTCRAHCDCFVQAVREILGLVHVNSDWQSYRHVTDSGIAAEIIQSTFSRTPGAGELDRICSRFVDLLKAQFSRDETSCGPVDGAIELLTTLQKRSDLAIALATGGWGEAARMKLVRAGLSVENAAFASADDSHSRQEIMSIAKDRAAAQHHVKVFDSFVYVGDAIWDLLACRSLGIPLIGVGTGSRADQLKAAGAKYLLPDYSDPRDFLNCLAAARSLSTPASSGQRGT